MLKKNSFFYQLQVLIKNSFFSSWHLRRHYLLVVSFLLLLIGLLLIKYQFTYCSFDIFLDYCQLRKSQLQQIAKLNNKNFVYSNAYRNNIIDRNGQLLAHDMIQFRLVINPKKIAANLEQKSENCSVAKTYAIIDPYLQKSNIHNYQQFLRFIADNKKRVYKRLTFVDFELKNQIDQQISKNGLNKCQHIYLSEFFYERFYPLAQIGGSLIGDVNYQEVGSYHPRLVGISGLERLFNPSLEITPVAQSLTQSRTGKVIEVGQFEQKINEQKNLQLSIDNLMQKIIYTELKKTVDQYKAANGAALLIDGKNGEVLALASYPSFDPNQRVQKVNYFNRKNYVYQPNINPGSILKPFVLAVALETDALKDGFEVDTDNEKIFSNGRLVKDSEKHGILDAQETIIFSSNIGIIKMMRTIKAEQFAPYFLHLNFSGSKVFDLAGEGTGLTKHPIEWDKNYYDYLATGYSLTTTLSHIVRSYSVFVNQGEMVDLTLLKTKPEQNIAKTKIFKKQTIEKMIPILKAVVEKGTANEAQVKGYQVMGKTGTSQILVDDSYQNNKYRALFVGILPDKKHQYIMGIYIEDPKGYNYYGGSVAGPVFARSMSKILKIY